MPNHEISTEDAEANLGDNIRLIVAAAVMLVSLYIVINSGVFGVIATPVGFLAAHYLAAPVFSLAPWAGQAVLDTLRSKPRAISAAVPLVIAVALSLVGNDAGGTGFTLLAAAVLLTHFTMLANTSAVVIETETSAAARAGLLGFLTKTYGMPDDVLSGSTVEADDTLQIIRPNPPELLERFSESVQELQEALQRRNLHIEEFTPEAFVIAARMPVAKPVSVEKYAAEQEEESIQIEKGALFA